VTVQSRAIVNVSQMARMVGLSRQRFWQLATEGVFLLPIYDIRTKRPFYDEPMQETNLKVRKTNYGLNGRPILFYSRRAPIESKKAEPRSKRSVPAKASPKHESLIEGLKQLGMASVTSAQVEEQLQKLYPAGQPDDEGEVLRTIFVGLMRRD